MRTSEGISDLAKALTEVQASLAPAKRDSTNPYYNSTYADLSSVWESCREPLAKNGLSVIQGNRVGEANTLIVVTILIHESGQWVQSELCLPLSKSDPQGVGSAMTYGRRYGLAAIVGIVADPDDDANAASAKNGNGNVSQMRQNERPVNGNRRPPQINQPTRGPISVS
ncbi:MAG: ERF family protein [Pyrinomonadaceae bacterium]|nr:ERF family protein [Pyrinomonadaceae bacterium]